MHYSFSDIVFMAGLIIFGGYFVYSGINHFLYRNSMAGYAGSKGIPQPMLATIATGVMLILGGFSVIFQFYMGIGLLLLVAFLVPTTFVMHAFWKITDPMARMGERVHFFKNIGLIGALLILIGIMNF